MTSTHEVPPIWAVAPFVAMLLAIAVGPLAMPRLWERHAVRGAISALLGLPTLAWLAVHDAPRVLHTGEEYLSFIVLLGSLYLLASGVWVGGGPGGTPATNTAILGTGTVLASLLGTTGATMLLVRPLLRANEHRKRIGHVVVFFIFMVGNVGGLLTPLGDPPLFLGFLRGVPFAWTFHLWPAWLTAGGVLAVVFFIIDTWADRHERHAAPPRAPLRVEGAVSLACLVGLLGVVLGTGTWHWPWGVPEGAMLALAAVAWFCTPTKRRAKNGFSWHPILEVAILFAGIFATMQPALMLLGARGGELGLRAPWHFFWLTGLLSSVLDNAPTYLTFTAAASAQVGVGADSLVDLVADPEGARLLAAISVGAVFMGANTYLGNGPNFMVKAVAEHHGVRMPGFFGYMAYSGAILLPLFGVLTWAFFS